MQADGAQKPLQSSPAREIGRCFEYHSTHVSESHGMHAWRDGARVEASLEGVRVRDMSGQTARIWSWPRRGGNLDPRRSHEAEVDAVLSEFGRW